MSAELQIHSPAGSARTIEVGEAKTIGRETDNDIALDDNLASRSHAMIRCQNNNSYYIVDLGSSNGTFVNGKPITVPTLINPGDEIMIGQTRLVFDHQQEEESPQPGGSANTPGATVRNFVSMTMAILVSDVRDFTPLTEKLPAETVSQIFSDWFRIVGKIIDECGGSVEQFRGDSVMAYWIKSPVTDSPDYAVNCLSAALKIVSASRKFNQEITQEYGEAKFAVGCGINQGNASMGNIGSDARRDFTLMGDCVNVTFRVEGLCSKLDRSILLTQIVKETVTDSFQFEDLGLHELKGKTEAERIFALPEVAAA